MRQATTVLAETRLGMLLLHLLIRMRLSMTQGLVLGFSVFGGGTGFEDFSDGIHGYWLVRTGARWPKASQEMCEERSSPVASESRKLEQSQILGRVKKLLWLRVCKLVTSWLICG